MPVPRSYPLPDVMKKFHSYISAILPYLFVFVASIFKPSDHDLGWHLKYGEYFFKNGRLLSENTFSTEMADFQWANIAWLTDVISYALFYIGGFFALSLAGAAVITLTFFFFAKAFRLSYWQKAIVFPLLIFMLDPLNNVSFRGQLISMTFLGVLYFFLEYFKLGKEKIIFAIPLLFLLWANVHGQFILGLGVLALWMGSYLLEIFLKERKISVDLKSKLKLFLLIGCLSLLAPFIHPYGYKVYFDAVIHFHNPLLKNVVEYVPAGELSSIWINQVLMAVFIGISVVTYLFKNIWKEKLTTVIPATVLYGLSLSVKRYTWSMYYMAIPFLTLLADFFTPPTKKFQHMFATIIFLLLFIPVIFLKLPLNQYTHMTWDTFCRDVSNCSPKGAEELKKYYVEGKTMTLYDWGGWMIWNYPEMKPSADGRMHLWEKDGYSAFRHDFYIEQNLADISYSKYDVVFTSKEKAIATRLQELRNDGEWELLFEDKTAVIYRRLPSPIQN